MLKILCKTIPDAVDTKVVKSDGKIIDDGFSLPKLAVKAKTEVGIICIDVAEIIKSNSLAFLLFCFSKSEHARMPSGVAMPPKPKRLAERLRQINCFASSDVFLNKSDTGFLSSFAILSESLLCLATSKIPIQTEYKAISEKVSVTLFSAPQSSVDKRVSGDENR